MSYCLTCLKTKKMTFYRAPAGTCWEIMDGEGEKRNQFFQILQKVIIVRSCNSYFLFLNKNSVESPWDSEGTHVS